VRKAYDSGSIDRQVMAETDTVLPRYRLAIWVDRRHWHGHATHKLLPGPGPKCPFANRGSPRIAYATRAVAEAAQLGS
jgi:G:T-mismatch repair DNA endonuclease (very short patch repair protein)